MSILASLIFCSCDEEYTMTLASGQYVSSNCPIENMIFGVNGYYLCRKDGSDEWEPFYGPIENFTFERGYEVKMRVEEIHTDPKPDLGSVIWRVKKIISKEKKDSDVGPNVKEVIWDSDKREWFYKE